MRADKAVDPSDYPCIARLAALVDAQRMALDRIARSREPGSDLPAWDAATAQLLAAEAALHAELAGLATPAERERWVAQLAALRQRSRAAGALLRALERLRQGELRALSAGSVSAHPLYTPSGRVRPAGLAGAACGQEA
jgi:hypothetical protein